MKTYRVGIVAVAIFLVSTGIGFGIAQAVGTQFEQPVLTFEDMESLEPGNFSSSYAETRPVLAFEDSSSPYTETRPVLAFDDGEAYQVAKSPPEVIQLENPIQTGALPMTSSEEPWMKGYGHD